MSNKKKDNLDASDLVFGKLITPINIDTDELTEYGEENIRYWEGSYSCFEYANFGELKCDDYEDIIIEKPTLGKIKKYSKATEILTGEQFNYVITYNGMIFEIEIGDWDIDFNFYRGRKYKPSNKKSLDAYVLIDVVRGEDNKSKKVTSKNLFEYMEEHIDVDEYRRKLQEIKERSLELRLDVKQAYKERKQKEKEKRIIEKQEKLIKEQKAKEKEIRLTENVLLLPDLVEEFDCSNNAKKVILEIIRNDSYAKLTTIEDYLRIIRKQYPNLTEEEYLSIVGIILRMNPSTDNNKPYLKAI